MKKILSFLVMITLAEPALAQQQMTPEQILAGVTQRAEKGDAQFQGILGGMYVEGYPEIDPNAELAFEWMKKAADQGLAMAQQTLGMMYESGLGTKKDNKLAMEYYAKAATQNWPRAYHDVGMMYFNGLGVQQDFDTALEYNKKGAELGDKHSKDFLDNVDVLKERYAQLEKTKDAENLIELQTTIRLAQTGYPQKQYELGLFYLTFAPMDENYYNQSKEWMEKAAAKNHPKAKEVLKDMIEQKADFGYLKHIVE